MYVKRVKIVGGTKGTNVLKRRSLYPRVGKQHGALVANRLGIRRNIV